MMLKVYIACGEVFDNKGDAVAAERTEYIGWVNSDDLAHKIHYANSTRGNENAGKVLRNYWEEYINVDVSIDCVKVIAPKECTVEISGADDDECVVCRILGSGECPE